MKADAKRKADRAPGPMARPAGAAGGSAAGARREAKPTIPIIMLDGTIADMANMRDTDINWGHVAETLSKVPRFNGRHPGPAISVAQHQVMGADAIFNETGDHMPAG
jgi:uncharacterized protein